jgi:hypothetical protein
MCVRDHHCVDTRGIEVKRLFVLIFTTVAALPDTAFEKDSVLLRFDQVARAGDLLCRTMKCN